MGNLVKAREVAVVSHIKKQSQRSGKQVSPAVMLTQFCCQGKQELRRFLYVNTMVFVQWWAATSVRKHQAKYYKLND